MDPENYGQIGQEEKAIRGTLVRGREFMDDLSRLVRGTLSHDDDRSEFHSPTSELLQKNGGPAGSGVRTSPNSGDEKPRDQGKRGAKKTLQFHSPTGSNSGDENPRVQGKISGRVSHSMTTVTHSPFADGYQWRKYGQKVIRNVKYPRSYYRCSDAGCRAKLLVQQITDSGSLPMYELTRNNEHTCNAVMNPPPAFQHSSSSPATPMRESNIITFESYQSVPSSFARGANNTEQLHNLDFSSSVQQMQNRSGEMLSPGSSSDSISSSSSLLNLSVPEHSHRLAPDIENNSDSSFFPPISPAGQFYGPDASAYL